MIGEKGLDGRSEGFEIAHAISTIGNCLRVQEAKSYSTDIRGLDSPFPMSDPRTALREAAKAANISLSELSKRVLKNHAYLQQFVTRGVPKRLPEDIRRFLAVELNVTEELLGGPAGVGGQAGVPGQAVGSRRSEDPPARTVSDYAVSVARYPSNASPPVPIPATTATIPMRGSGVAGLDGRFVLNGNRIMDVLCPPQLLGVPDAYGVFVHGGSMEPRYHPGEAVFVNPHLPVRQGDYVVVQIAEGDAGDETAGYVKRFRSMNARELVLEQYQEIEDVSKSAPKDDRFVMRFDRTRVIAVHKIVGSGIA